MRHRDGPCVSLTGCVAELFHDYLCSYKLDPRSLASIAWCLNEKISERTIRCA